MEEEEEDECWMRGICDGENGETKWHVKGKLAGTMISPAKIAYY